MVSLGGEGAFPPGSTVHFKTALGASLQAQVVCFDPALKVLVVRDTSSGKATLRMFNIALISEIREIAGPANGDTLETMFSPSSMSNQQVNDRSALAENRRCIEAMETDVPLEGQRAFIQLRRTLDDVRWKGEDISVLERVVVRPPYTPESAAAVQESLRHFCEKSTSKTPLHLSNKLNAHEAGLSGSVMGPFVQVVAAIAAS